ncbi:hypothetical protein [Gordonia sp. NPDC003429]
MREKEMAQREGRAGVSAVVADRRVAVAVSDPGTPALFTQIRGRVVEMTSDGGVDSINALAHKYTGKPYAWYGGREQTRLILTIEADRIATVP